MLNQKEMKQYILSHRAELQKLDDDFVDEMNKFFKKTEKDINDIELIIYKRKKLQNPDKHYDKPAPFKTKPFEYQKIKDSYLKNLYTLKHNNHKEKVGSIDLTPYLNKIRNKKKENELILLIKNNKVIKEFILSSDKHTYVCSPSDMAKVKQEAIKHKADVYMVHNHPVLIVANPSFQDIRSYLYQDRDFKKAGIKILDFGVVTFDDYFSVKQNIKVTNKAIKIAKSHGIKNKIVLELIKIAFLTKGKRVFTNKQSSHPVIIYSRKKKDKIKAIPNKKYKQLQKQARKEFDKIIKLHPEYQF